MTANEIINTAFSLLGENADEYPDKKMVLQWLNITFAESVCAENQLRRKNGEEEIFAIKTITALDESIDVHSRISGVCLPYGVAAYLAADRENNYMAAVMRNRFIRSLQESAGTEEKQITDCYSGGAM